MCEVYVFGANRQQRMLASAANAEVGKNCGDSTNDVDTRLTPIREIIVLPPTVAGRSYHRPVVPDDPSALRLYSLPAGTREVVLHTRLIRQHKSGGCATAAIQTMRRQQITGPHEVECK